MSFLRHSLSKVFATKDCSENQPGAPDASLEKEPSPESFADSGYGSMGSWSKNAETDDETHRLTSSSSPSKNNDQNHATPKNPSARHTLQKAASTTFRVIADSLRSKTPLFYSENPQTPSPPHSQPPNRLTISNRQKSITVSKQPPTVLPRTSSRVQNQGAPSVCQELCVEIPDACLLDPHQRASMELPDPELPPPGLDPEAGPNGMTLNLKKLSLDLAPVAVDFSLVHGQPGLTKQSNLGKPIAQSPASIAMASAHPSKQICPHPEDTGCTTDAQITNATVDPCLPPTGISQPTWLALTTYVPPKLQDHGSLFVKGCSKRILGHNLLSPYRQKMLTRTSFEGVTGTQITPNPCLKHASNAVGSCQIETSSKLPMNSIFSERHRPLIRPFSASESSIVSDKQEISTGYEADSESDVSEAPSMGSKLAWTTFRAARQERYRDICAMKSEQSEPETETDEGFGYDLERFFPASSRRCDHHSLREKDSIYTDFASSHQIQFQESDVPNSHAASLRYTLEAFDQADGLALDSSGHGHADNYAVEAIERATGSELASNSESEISATILNRPSSETPVKFLESQSPDRHPVQTSDALIDSQEYGPIDSLENWTTDHRMAKADDGSNGHAPEDDNGAEWDTDAEDGKLRVLSTNATFVAARLPIFGPICPLEPPVDSQRIFGNLFKNKCDQNEFDSSETQTKEDSALESQSDWKSVDGLGDETKGILEEGQPLEERTSIFFDTVPIPGKAEHQPKTATRPGPGFSCTGICNSEYVEFHLNPMESGAEQEMVKAGWLRVMCDDNDAERSDSAVDAVGPERSPVLIPGGRKRKRAVCSSYGSDWSVLCLGE